MLEEVFCHGIGFFVEIQILVALQMFSDRSRHFTALNKKKIFSFVQDVAHLGTHLLDLPVHRRQNASHSVLVELDFAGGG